MEAGAGALHQSGTANQGKSQRAYRTYKREKGTAFSPYHLQPGIAVRLAELTEELEELRTEKALLLQKFEHVEDAGAKVFRRDIATMEAGLKKLEAQEQHRNFSRK